MLCSFEDKLEHTNPWQDGTFSGPGLQIQLARPSRGQLALVHENLREGDMKELVERVFEEGYSHVYTTDVSHKKRDGSFAALWNIAPPYLVQQAEAVRAGLDEGWRPRVKTPNAE